MHNICPNYAQDMPKICPRYAQDMHKICLRYALVGGENCPTSIIPVCDLANHALGGLRCPLCFPTRLCIPESDRPDFIVCPTITMGAYNPMPLWPVIACIIIKLAALCSALGEVYCCCGTQFVHCSRLASRQKAKLYPANTLTHLPASLQPTPPLEIHIPDNCH